MFQYCKLWLDLNADKRAVTALEYGLIAAAVVAIGLVGFGPLMTALSGEFNKVALKLT